MWGYGQEEFDGKVVATCKMASYFGREVRERKRAKLDSLIREMVSL